MEIPINNAEEIVIHINDLQNSTSLWVLNFVDDTLYTKHSKKKT